MTNASASRQALLSAKSWARPHRGRGAGPEEVLEPYYRVPSAGGVNGSIMDLTLWMRAQMGLAPQVLPQTRWRRCRRRGSTRPARRGGGATIVERTPIRLRPGWRVFNYAGNKVVGHHGGVRGYRSLILFDPARKSGVVALWNMGTRGPNGIEYEVMDMIYGLPFKDWLRLSGGSGAPAPPPVQDNGAEEIPEGEGEDARVRPDQR
jgi:beta-lactamase class C